MFFRKFRDRSALELNKNSIQAALDQHSARDAHLQARFTTLEQSIEDFAAHTEKQTATLIKQLKQHTDHVATQQASIQAERAVIAQRIEALKGVASTL